MSQEKEYSELLDRFKGVNPFKVPSLYFDQNTEQFLNQLDSRLAEDIGFTKKNDFRLPKEYFENTVDSTLHLIQLEKSLRELDYKVPDHYFENLGNRVVSKIQNDNSGGTVRKFNFRLRQIASIAAMVIVVAGIFFIRNNKPETSTFNLSQIDDETLIEFIATQDIDLKNISEVLDEQQINEMNFQNESIEDSELNELIENF